jgi:Ser/Thr protein kinase RdoA (MazF antagonist)
VSRLAPEDLAVSRLGGLSHTNYKVETEAGAFVVQIPVPDPHAPERGQALEATRLAGRLGIGAELVHVDAATGLLITRWIAEAKVLAPDRVDAMLGDIAALLRRWHRSGARLQPVDPFEAFDRLRASLATQAVSPRLEAALERARAELGRTENRVPIHGDTSLENFLETPRGLVLIDWEYAGLGDPAWDLAVLLIMTGRSSAREAGLLAAYGDPDIDLRRLRLNQLLAATLTGLWLAAHASRAASPVVPVWIAPRFHEAEELAAALYPDTGSG